jgi:hypothetical protein
MKVHKKKGAYLLSNPSRGNYGGTQGELPIVPLLFGGTFAKLTMRGAKPPRFGGTRVFPP